MSLDWAARNNKNIIKFRRVLAGFGRFWQVKADFDTVSFEKDGQVLRRIDKFWQVFDRFS